MPLSRTVSEIFSVK